jgi:hypothetical protein
MRSLQNLFSQAEENRTVLSEDFVNPGSFDYRLKSPIHGTTALAEVNYMLPADFKSRKDKAYGAYPAEKSVRSGTTK